MMVEPDVKNFFMMWFGSPKSRQLKPSEAIDGSQSKGGTSATGGSTELNQLVKIFDNQGQSQDLPNSIDNQSRFSDFSLNLNRVKRAGQEFFDF